MRELDRRQYKEHYIANFKVSRKDQERYNIINQQDVEAHFDMIDKNNFPDKFEQRMTKQRSN